MQSGGHTYTTQRRQFCVDLLLLAVVVNIQLLIYDCKGLNLIPRINNC
jgi:hypothetical protein